GLESPHDQSIEPVGLEGPAHQEESYAHLRESSDARDGRHFPVAEMAGQEQHALALVIRVDERIEVLDANERELALAREPAKAQELAGEAPQVAVVRLREIDDLVLVERGAEHAPE